MNFIIVGVCSLFTIYEFLAYYQFLSIPLINIGISNNYAVLLSALAYKWSIIIGICGIFYAILGYISFKDKPSIGLKIGVPVFYLVFSILLII